jgi:hypothetical protein
VKKKIAVALLSNCGLGVDEAGGILMSWLEKAAPAGGL